MLEQPGRGRVARLVGVENLLEMRVTARLPQDGTMVCAAADHLLETPLADGCAVGDAVTVGIRASDIILAAGPLPESSARNTWAGIVSEVTLRPPGYEVTLDCDGVPLRCHITGTSLEAMGITTGPAGVGNLQGVVVLPAERLRGGLWRSGRSRVGGSLL